MLNKQITRNLFYSIFAQIISLSVSFITGLIVPKLVPEVQYAYWQSYILYVGYAGVFHFGILDGIVLRFSQYDYAELDKQRIRSHFVFVLIIDTVLSILLYVISRGLNTVESRRIFLFVALGLISKNIFSYSSFLLQITNQISRYARLVIMYRVIYGILVVFILVSRINRFELFCLADLVSDTIGISYCVFLCKEAFIGNLPTRREASKDILQSFKSGIKLMISNFTSGLLISGAKMMIQFHWGDLVFGQVSFAFSLSSLFLTFISAISVVLFPSLKRMDKNEYPSFYVGLRRISTRLLFGALVLYFPGYVILSRWLPNYATSLSCWGILLPYIVFSVRIGLLTNNYLKAYRKEQAMLLINMCFALIAMIMYSIMMYIFDNMIAVLLCVVVSIVSISIISELIVSKIIDVPLIKDIISDFIMVGIFFCAANIIDLKYGFVLYLLAYLIYCLQSFLMTRKKFKC